MGLTICWHRLPHLSSSPAHGLCAYRLSVVFLLSLFLSNPVAFGKGGVRGWRGVGSGVGAAKRQAEVSTESGGAKHDRS